jgi:hypothetical protein
LNGKPLKSPKSLIAMIALMIWMVSFPGHSSAQSCCTGALSGELVPENTVILANQADARFSQDFSMLLKHLRPKWVVMDSATVPDSVKDKNLILLGRLDAAYTGEIMRGMMTAEEIETIRAAAGKPVVLEKDSPWMEGRSVTICTGADLLLTRNAAEEAVRAIIATAPPASMWIQTTFDAPLDKAVREYVDQLRFTWDDAELPLADLMIDVGAKPRWRISAPQAAEDVERLFYLFSHAYAGYAFFNQNGEFEQAKARILEELATRSNWSSKGLARLLYEQLSFISDCHMKIGDYQYAGHADFWYDTSLALTLGWKGYQFAADGALYTVVSINDQDPEAFVFPSLDSHGDPMYRLGMLSKAEPASLLLVAANDVEERRFEIVLQRSDFAYYSKDLFREDEVGGIPVIRIRSFSDHHADALNPFVETASAHRGEPVIIVDVRGNGGGNEAWPIRWIQGLTGQRAESVFVFSELNSKTTMAGRANVFAYMYDLYPRTDSYREEAERFTNIAGTFENEARQPSWVGPYYPPMPLIANDTTLIIVMNDRVASSGEGLIMRASQAEDVVLVGENSKGCLTFGNAGAFQLPRSRLMVHLPINFGLYLDMEFREEKGLTPDLWVPAADAVNYAVAAVRSGTITTRQPLSPTMLQQPFVPEDPWARVWQVRVLVTVLPTAAGSVWAYFMRKKPRIVAAVGGVWLAIGSVWILMKRPVGFGFLLTGVVCLVWGGINLWRARRAPVEGAA